MNRLQFNMIFWTKNFIVHRCVNRVKLGSHWRAIGKRKNNQLNSIFQRKMNLKHSTVKFL